MYIVCNTRDDPYLSNSLVVFSDLLLSILDGHNPQCGCHRRKKPQQANKQIK
jgi:hypothetical protein